MIHNEAIIARHPAPLRRVGWWVGGFGLAVAGTILLRLHDPNAADSPFAPCIFHALSGFWCPGCGITRALHAIVHGDIARAFTMNPLATLLIPFGALAFAWAGGWRPAWAAPIIQFLSKPMLWVVLIPTYWIARNLPWPVLSWMAPG